MRIRYSPAAREDLRELRQYLVGEFGAVVADGTVRIAHLCLAICPHAPLKAN